MNHMTQDEFAELCRAAADGSIDRVTALTYADKMSFDQLLTLLSDCAIGEYERQANADLDNWIKTVHLR